MGTKLFLLVNFWDNIFKTVFPKQCFLFSTLNSKLSWNICKLRPKVRNGQNIPHESPNFTNYFFQSNFTYNFSNVSTSLTPHYQILFFVFYSKFQNVYEHVYLASQIVKWQNGRRSNFYMVKWTLIYAQLDVLKKKKTFLRQNWKFWDHFPFITFMLGNFLYLILTYDLCKWETLDFQNNLHIVAQHLCRRRATDIATYKLNKAKAISAKLLVVNLKN